MLASTGSFTSTKFRKVQRTFAPVCAHFSTVRYFQASRYYLVKTFFLLFHVRYGRSPSQPFLIHTAPRAHKGKSVLSLSLRRRTVASRNINFTRVGRWALSVRSSQQRLRRCPSRRARYCKFRTICARRVGIGSALGPYVNSRRDGRKRRN